MRELTVVHENSMYVIKNVIDKLADNARIV